MHDLIEKTFGPGAPLIELFSGLLMFIGMIFLIAFVGFLLFQVICLWKMFGKMGEKGWKAVVPFYNVWILSKHAWGQDKGWISLFWLIPIVGVFVSGITYWRIYDKFGKNTLFCLIGFFIRPIANAACAFDRSVYQPDN